MIQRLQPRIQVLRAGPKALDYTGTPRLRGTQWVKRRASWLRKHPLCCHCEAEGQVTAGQEVDHITPLWKGGADNESNYQTLCKPHHEVKTALEAKERARGS